MIRNTTGQTAIHLEFRWPSVWTRLAAQLDFATAAVSLIGIEVLAADSKLPEYLLESSERLDDGGASTG
ncbi:hypothetical protein [Streptomyces sp. NPDC002722]|uniref:hypothetical protein n=1 Tax=unclassified Streptomyces TaxID=2593676 RepID=UPI0033265070